MRDNRSHGCPGSNVASQPVPWALPIRVFRNQEIGPGQNRETPGGTDTPENRGVRPDRPDLWEPPGMAYPPSGAA
ncbi:hypothetical protein FHX37_2340 [Haloactinospora alba]|uniref:Uncharacterized protein n=1 Tax=Haloactinospora alba TaxID=405555 RepID=A0A543NKI7_9ACTN|nr:hypothetical protein FHX37_2340 [Haloactinospora alba]